MKIVTYNMLTINNIDKLLHWNLQCTDNRIPAEMSWWRCFETIDYDTQLENEDTYYYRFEFENPNAGIPLCIYLPRECDHMGNYELENNLMNTKGWVKKEGVENINMFKMVLISYIEKVLIEWTEDQKQ